MTTTTLRRLAAAATLVATVGAATIASSTAASAAPSTTDSPAAACSTTPAPANAETLCATPDELLDVRIGDVHPTQPSLGYDEVYYKLGRYSSTLSKDAVNKRFGDWCEANGQTDVVSARPDATLQDPSTFTCETPVGSETADSIAAMKTVVIGPGGTLYLTDGHHTLTSFAETPDGGLNTHVRLRVLGNLSGLSESEFWATMQENKWVWLRDVNGDAITPTQLPTSVGLANFEDDKARSIMYFARDIGYTADGAVPFQEFYWGSWLRAHPEVGDLTTWNQDDFTSSLALVKSITEAQTALPQDSVVDAESGYTAADLGTFAHWNDGKAENKGEFAKLSAPYSDTKPGKLAYMVAYRATLPVAPVVTAPDAPAVPTASVSGHDITVTWAAPASDGGSSVSGYTVSLSGGPSGVAPQTVAASATSATFTGLTAGDYIATVTATNSAGSSVASGPSAAVTVATVSPVTPVVGSLVVSGDLVAGGVVTIEGSGFAPSTTGFSVELHSHPIVLGAASTDSSGAFALTATLPSTVPAGEHEVIVLLNGVQVGGSAVTVGARPVGVGVGVGAGAGAGAGSGAGAGAGDGTSAGGSIDAAADLGASLAFTGSQAVAPIVAGGALLLLLGAGALIVAARRRRAAVAGEPLV